MKQNSDMSPLPRLLQLVEQIGPNKSAFLNASLLYFFCVDAEIGWLGYHFQGW
jgi:hypothetical protein